jgi:hypothetical protein
MITRRLLSLLRYRWFRVLVVYLTMGGVGAMVGVLATLWAFGRGSDPATTVQSHPAVWSAVLIIALLPTLWLRRRLEGLAISLDEPAVHALTNGRAKVSVMSGVIIIDVGGQDTTGGSIAAGSTTHTRHRTQPSYAISDLVGSHGALP